jgi:hypothetical protein
MIHLMIRAIREREMGERRGVSPPWKPEMGERRGVSPPWKLKIGERRGVSPPWKPESTSALRLDARQFNAIFARMLANHYHPLRVYHHAARRS